MIKKSTGYLKYTAVLGLIAALVALTIWINGLYRSSTNNYMQTVDKCLISATDEELRMRMLSLGDKYKAWFAPSTDTSTYITKTITVDDGRVFHARIRKDDPTAMAKIRQFYFHLGDCRLNVRDVDSLFKSYMAENSLPVKEGYIEFLDLENGRLIANNAPEGRLWGYNMASNVDTLDFFKTLGVRAYMNTSARAILQPVKYSIVFSLVFGIIAIICIVKLLRDILKLHRQGFRLLRNMAKQNKRLLNDAAEEAEEASEELEMQQLLEEADRFKAISDRLYDTSNKNRKLELYLDNREGKLQFCETPVLLQPLFKELQEKYEGVTRKKVTVSVDVTPDLILYVDEVFFTSIMEELLENSIKFSGDSVHIQIKAWRDLYHLFITVRDNGWGIHKEEIGLVFDLSYKGLSHDSLLPTDLEGLGAGLTYAQSLMHSFGSKIYIHSEQNVYTEVMLKFPLTRDRKNAESAFKLIYRGMSSLNSVLYSGL